MLSAIRFTVIELTYIDHLLDWIVRIVLACICGFIIGYERKTRSKEAGIRTHAIVCMAAAIMILVSKYGFADITINESGARGADSARVAAQIVSGIGFLGAGIIYVRRDILHGLTTAAGMWATAGIGMAIGAGMYIIGVVSTLILVLLQIILHRPIKLFHETSHLVLRVTAKLEDDKTLDKIKEIFEVKKFLQVKTTRTDDGCVAVIELATVKQMSANDIYAIINANGFITSVEQNEEL